MDIDPYYQRHTPKIGVTSKITFMRIFPADRWTGGIKWQWGGRKWWF